jgi:hypothetical protein
LAQGRGLIKSARRVARRYHGRSLKCDPDRRIALKPGTLLRIYHRWKRGGGIPAALYLGYVAGRRYIDGALLVRFINFAASHAWPSFKAAHKAFCERGGNHGPGRMSGRKLDLKYDALRWNLPRGCFAQLQREYKAIGRARRKIASLRAGFIAEIGRRVPARLPRRQPKGAEFSI